MTKAKTVIPPQGEVPRAECQHSLAGPRSFRCPDCQGILRRCCQSILNHPHRDACWAKK